MAERKFSSDWVTYHAPHWLRWLDHLKGKQGVKGLEIGSYEGRSACWFCDNILTGDGATLTCIDGWWRNYRYDSFCNNTEGLPVLVRKGMSRDVLPRLYCEGERFDFVYVDGSHWAADALYDGCVSWTLLKPGGIMLFDDYGWTDSNGKITNPPKPAIDAFLACYKERIASHEIAPNQAAIWKPVK